MKISLVIPTYTITQELERYAVWAAISYREQVDELIITEDGGMFSPELMKLADHYIINSENVGFTKNVNLGWKFATGDFVCIVNSDTELEEGNLSDLCLPGKVTSPVVKNQLIPRLSGNFWCSPAEVTKERGYLIEDFHTYCSDSEYDERVSDIFMTIPTVKIPHYGSQTITVSTMDADKQLEADRTIYQKLREEGKVK